MGKITEDKKYVLEGVFIEFDQQTRNRLYYTEEEFAKHIKELEIRIRKKQRKKLSKKIMKVKNVI